MRSVFTTMHHKRCILSDSNALKFMMYDVRDFAQFYNPLHGNCYVYNSGWNSRMKLKISTKGGRRHGQASKYFTKRILDPLTILNS